MLCQACFKNLFQLTVEEYVLKMNKAQKTVVGGEKSITEGPNI